MVVPEARAPMSIVRDLVALGVREGDALMAHVSMRALGPVDGGTRGLVEALDRAVGSAGTVLVPALRRLLDSR